LPGEKLVELSVTILRLCLLAASSSRVPQSDDGGDWAGDAKSDDGEALAGVAQSVDGEALARAAQSDDGGALAGVAQSDDGGALVGVAQSDDGGPLAGEGMAEVVVGSEELTAAPIMLHLLVLIERGRARETLGPCGCCITDVHRLLLLLRRVVKTSVIGKAILISCC
jgi:hypothetical protein